MDTVFDIADIKADARSGMNTLYSYLEASPTMVYDTANNADSQHLVIAVYLTCMPSLCQVESLEDMTANGTVLVVCNAAAHVQS